MIIVFFFFFSQQPFLTGFLSLFQHPWLPAARSAHCFQSLFGQARSRWTCWPFTFPILGGVFQPCFPQQGCCFFSSSSSSFFQEQISLLNGTNWRVTYSMSWKILFDDSRQEGWVNEESCNDNILLSALLAPILVVQWASQTLVPPQLYPHSYIYALCHGCYFNWLNALLVALYV